MGLYGGGLGLTNAFRSEIDFSNLRKNKSVMSSEINNTILRLNLVHCHFSLFNLEVF